MSAAGTYSSSPLGVLDCDGVEDEDVILALCCGE
jgi:hypothetical protein